ncbi:MAG TPA: RNA polymerase sigma-70 factor [Chryseosolibacter sp.]|nr:RNA polymerase sigma-70 factor [Chryseosolibacter sp.]
MNRYQHDTDLEIITALNNGDENAFAEVYRRHASELIHFIHRSIPYKETCEEIVQDIFLTLWSRREQLTPTGTIRAYLYKSARHKIVDYVRHSIVKQKYEQHYRLFEAVYEELPAETHDQNVSEVIDATIAALPEKCQMAIRMRLHEDLSYQEIASRMKISVKTVEKHISAALKELRVKCKGYSSA